MGTGTAPEEGAALAVALLEEFRARARVDARDDASRSAESLRLDDARNRERGDGIRRGESAADVPAARRRAGHIERNRNRAAAGLAGARGGACAREPFARIARGARLDRVSASQPRRNGTKSSARRAKNLRSLKPSAARCRPSGSSGRKNASPSWKRIFAETQKRLESEVARLAADIKDRALHAQLEKQSGRRMGKIASDARAEADAAVVETLAASQADLGVAAVAPAKPVAPEQLSCGQRVAVKGFKQPVIFRRHDGRMAEVEAGAAADEGSACGYRRHRDADSKPASAAAGASRGRVESRFTRSRATNQLPRRST